MERADWAPVVVGVVLFVLLSPGLLVEVPGSRGRLRQPPHQRPGRAVDFGSLRTNGPAVLIHTVLFFALYALAVVVLRLHIYP